MSTIAIWITFFAFMFTFTPDSIEETFVFGGYISQFGYLLILASLLIGYVLVWLKKKSLKQAESEAM
jgi:spore germination protein